MNDLVHDNSSNVGMTIDSVLKNAKRLGGEAAMGGDALPKLALTVLDAADKGVLTDDKDKVTGKDDVDRIYANYLEGYGKKAVYDNTEAGKKANASKLRQVAKMGLYAGSKYDPMQAVADLKDFRESAKAKEQKVKGMYPCIVELARAQLKLDRQITMQEIEAIVLKQEAETKPVDEVLGKMREQLDKIITGEHKSGQCNDPRVVSAHNQLRDYLAGIEQEREEKEDEQLLAAIMTRQAARQQAANTIEHVA